MLHDRILQISFSDLIASSVPRSSPSISNPRRGGDGHKVFALFSSAQHDRGDPKSRNDGKLPQFLKKERRKITPIPKEGTAENHLTSLKTEWQKITPNPNRRNGRKLPQILKDGTAGNYPNHKRRSGRKSSQILKDGIMVHTSHSLLSVPLLYHSGVLVVYVSEIFPRFV